MKIPPIHLFQRVVEIETREFSVLDAGLETARFDAHDCEPREARHAIDAIPWTQIAGRTDDDLADRADDFVRGEVISGALPTSIEASVLLRDFVEAGVVLELVAASRLLGFEPRLTLGVDRIFEHGTVEQRIRHDSNPNRATVSR
jgi:hypothetical protein